MYNFLPLSDLSYISCHFFFTDSFAADFTSQGDITAGNCSASCAASFQGLRYRSQISQIAMKNNICEGNMILSKATGGKDNNIEMPSYFFLVQSTVLTVFHNQI